MTVLVTGGAGFIGSHVVDLLVANGHEVRVLDRASPTESGLGRRNPEVEYVTADVRERIAVAHASSGVDAVIHHAAKVGLGNSFGDITEYVSVNDLGTSVLLAALHASGFSGRLVLASSMVVYGEGVYDCARHGKVRPPPRTSEALARGEFDPICPSCGSSLAPRPVTEDAPTDPRSVYAATKLHQEHLCAAFGREAGASVIALRYHNVYGPRMPRDTLYAGVASIFLSALERGDPPLVTEDGEQLRDFVHVADVARANLAALEADDAAAGAYNVASGVRRSIKELAGALARSFGPGAPDPIVTGEYRLGDVRHVFASPAKSRAALSWAAQVTLEAGLRELAPAR